MHCQKISQATSCTRPAHSRPAPTSHAPAFKSRNPKPLPFSLKKPRLSTPSLSVADLPADEPIARPRPCFVVKNPAHSPGTPKPAPVFTRKVSLSVPASVTGGKSAPSNWSRPASVAQFSPPPKSTADAPFQQTLLQHMPLPVRKPLLSKSLCLPQARAPRFVSARALTESRRQKMTEQFRNIMTRVGTHCLLHSILADSSHPDQHIERLLAAFAVNTLQSIPVALLVDFLHAALSSKRQDRAVHRTSCGTAIKALRWLAKHLQWQALHTCTQNNLVTSYTKQVEAYDKREAIPIPLSLVVAWEQCICEPGTPLTTKLVLGAILVCAHSSIRFGNAQRVRWGSLQLSTQGLRATAYATKTTKAGQPFFCTWHGLSGRRSTFLPPLSSTALGKFSHHGANHCKPNKSKPLPRPAPSRQVPVRP